MAMTIPPPTTAFLVAPLEGLEAALLALVRADEVPEAAEADEAPLVDAPTAAVPVDERGDVAVVAVG
jgi:hypothetical protein